MTQPLILRTLTDINQYRQTHLRSGEKLVLVPTMGNLHAGHLALVDKAKTYSDNVVVSIFVNPTQFGPTEDLATYPRTFTDDCAKLAARGVSAVFYPEVATIYPHGVTQTLSIDFNDTLTKILCAADRPTHFQGVATVVAKLFQLIRPDVAIFGQKDYQQLAVIRRLVDELFMPIVIDSIAIRREDNGLAMSSRNQYLSDDQRQLAGEIYATLQRIKTAILAGNPAQPIIDAAMAALTTRGIAVEYLAYRDADDLTQSLCETNPPRQCRSILLIAARIGSTRLIDNLFV